MMNKDRDNKHLVNHQAATNYHPLTSSLIRHKTMMIPQIML